MEAEDHLRIDALGAYSGDRLTVSGWLVHLFEELPELGVGDSRMFGITPADANSLEGEDHPRIDALGAYSGDRLAVSGWLVHLFEELPELGDGDSRMFGITPADANSLEGEDHPRIEALGAYSGDRLAVSGWLVHLFEELPELGEDSRIFAAFARPLATFSLPLGTFFLLLGASGWLGLHLGAEYGLVRYLVHRDPSKLCLEGLSQIIRV
jgi:hypothetical protein